jgi:hypothetical protein
VTLREEKASELTLLVVRVKQIKRKRGTKRVKEAGHGGGTAANLVNLKVKF